MKLRNLILAAFTLMTSCATPKKMVTSDEQQSNAQTQTKTNKYEFDLSFMAPNAPEAYVDSIGQIHFADSILEQRIKATLQLETASFISTTIADTVTNLSLKGDRSDKPSGQIKSLDGLQYFRNLKNLDITDNAVADLGPIHDLVYLEKFVAGNNQIENVTPLGLLTSLKEVNLYHNNVADLSPISNLTNIEKLGLWDNNISDIRALGQFSKLQDVNLGRNKISDISPLIHCKALHTIWLASNPLMNSELLSAFAPTLQVLSIANCRITQINYLENCQKLKELIIFNNQICDISCMYKMSNLNTLLASKNRIENIDVIPVLIRQGAFQERSRFKGGHGNIDLKDNPINFETEKNKQIKAYIENNVRGVEL